jgi:Domain of unknown function (DUF305)
LDAINFISASLQVSSFLQIWIHVFKTSLSLNACYLDITAANCAMMAGMTTGNQVQQEDALFVYQMIPHHQNAVNMAKIMLKRDFLNCDDLADDKHPDCILEGILRDIINTQNLQIQAMYDFLDVKGYPQTDDCDVEVVTLESLVPGAISRASSTCRRSFGALVGSAALANAILA